MLWIAVVTLAFGQEVEFEGTTEVEEELEAPEVSLSAELGGTVTSGNTRFFNLSGALASTYRWKKHRLSLDASSLTGRGKIDADGDGTLSNAELGAESVQTTRQHRADARYDRYFGERNSLYLLAGALHDPYAGYTARVHEQLGYSRTLVDTGSTTLVGEIGLDWAQEVYVSDVDPGYRDILAGRLLLGFSHTFGENASFSETLEIYENVIDPEDLRLLNEAAITATISEALGLKLSHQLTFDNQPVDGFRPLDQTALATLVVNLL